MDDATKNDKPKGKRGRPKGAKDSNPRKPKAVRKPKNPATIFKKPTSPKGLLPYQTETEPAPKKATTVRGGKKQKAPIIPQAKGKQGYADRKASLMMDENLHQPVQITYVQHQERGAPAYQWTKAVEDILFGRLSDGEALKAICQDPGMPVPATVYKRIMDDDEFAQLYSRAREVQADNIADEILEIADDGRNDWMERHGKDAEGWLLNGEHTARSRLRIDSRKWYLEKIAPKKYGSAMRIEGEQTVKHTVDDKDMNAFQEVANRALDRWKSQGFIGAPKKT